MQQKATELPAPLVVEHEGLQIVRDDLLPGGTKRRAIDVFFDEDHEEYVYASPVYGFAQLALAYAAADHGKRATIFCAKRQTMFHRTLEADAAGAQIYEIPYGYLNVVRARAREYCEQNGAKLLPFGLDDPVFIDALAEIARGLHLKPDEVWCVAGSGCLTRALQQAWPQARHFAVRIGAAPHCGRARVYAATERYEQPARERPPYPACAEYDAKLWTWVRRYAAPGALVWNVG